MLRDNFGYNGNNADAKEFVNTVNNIAKLLNGMEMDYGKENGGTSVAVFTQEDNGLKIDLTRLFANRVSSEPAP